jgi:hypothetical protein
VAGGGLLNAAAGDYATVGGGLLNAASGDYAFAAGRQAKANNQGCFVWGDSTNADLTCADNDRTIFRSSGGFTIYTSSDLSTGAHLPAGSNTWQPIPGAPSDRNLKQDLVPIDAQEVLERVAALPLSTWSYKTSQGVRHIGPMAQDFHAAFGLGEDDTHIHTLDASGVALAAIQGLHEQNQALEAQNAELRARVDDLETRLEALEQALGTSESADPAGTASPNPLQSSLLPGAGMLVLAVAAVWGARHRGGIQ